MHIHVYKDIYIYVLVIYANMITYRNEDVMI